jgi:hypothetical protein
MANRKATFAKRQREMDLKDRAKAKESRRLERRSAPNAGKGPVIAWDEMAPPPSVVDPDAPVVPDPSLPPPTPPASDDRSGSGHGSGNSSSNNE